VHLAVGLDLHLADDRDVVLGDAGDHAGRCTPVQAFMSIAMPHGMTLYSDLA
jgi:hypothetical protein